MAKTARKNRKRNARRRQRELRAAMRGAGLSLPTRNYVVIGMNATCKGGPHIHNGDGGNRKKEASRRVCRTRVSGDEE
jgi:hypothetical protein